MLFFCCLIIICVLLNNQFDCIFLKQDIISDRYKTIINRGIKYGKK